MRRSLVSLACAIAAVAGCGDSGNGGTDPGHNTIASPNGTNAVGVVVDLGPTGSNGSPVGYVNGAFVTVTVCVPGTGTCQDVDHVLVDTGSAGLRLLANDGVAGGKLSLALPAQQDAGGNAIAECAQFLDGFTWGPVQRADVRIGGEKASGVPIQVISEATYPVPANCESVGVDESRLEGDTGLFTNGILGIGLFLQDCGEACTVSPDLPASGNPGLYYSCRSGAGCSETGVSLAAQVSNPVAMFPVDNNGVILELPLVPAGGAATVSGTLVFGIGTQSNNGMAGASVFPTDGTGRFTTVYPASGAASATYPGSFIDSGSNGLFFLDSSTSGIPTCPDVGGFYCPSASMDLSAVNKGAGGTPSGAVNFSIGNAHTLLTTNNAAFSNLGGPNAGTPGQHLDSAFDWGLPFFYGRNVFTAIEGASTPGGSGPYFAY